MCMQWSKPRPLCASPACAKSFMHQVQKSTPNFIPVDIRCFRKVCIQRSTTLVRGAAYSASLLKLPLSLGRFALVFEVPRERKRPGHLTNNPPASKSHCVRVTDRFARSCRCYTAQSQAPPDATRTRRTRATRRGSYGSRQCAYDPGALGH